MVRPESFGDFDLLADFEAHSLGEAEFEFDDELILAFGFEHGVIKRLTLSDADDLFIFADVSDVKAHRRIVHPEAVLPVVGLDFGENENHALVVLDFPVHQEHHPLLPLAGTVHDPEFHGAFGSGDFDLLKVFELVNSVRVCVARGRSWRIGWGWSWGWRFGLAPEDEERE